jgi:hypothetical protein
MRVLRLSIVGALLALAFELVAQTPSPCANACLQTYKAAVKACNGNPACLAAARTAAVSCVKACGF